MRNIFLLLTIVLGTGCNSRPSTNTNTLGLQDETITITAITEGGTSRRLSGRIRGPSKQVIGNDIAIFREIYERLWADGLMERKSCVPYYGNVIYFENGDKRLSLYLCFSCLIFQLQNPGDSWAHEGGNFDHLEYELSNFVSKYFPIK